MKEKAIGVRDQLNEMAVDILSGNPDMEDHVVACCLAVAIEELEKWIYDNGWTPSVRPYIDDRKFKIPFPAGSKKDKSQAGPPWNRKKVGVLDRFPTVKKLKEQGRLEQNRVVISLPTLRTTPIDDWEPDLLEPFRDGSRAKFMHHVRFRTGASVKSIHEFLDESISKYDVWGIDMHDGNSCPRCKGTDISASTNREYACDDCGTQWGHPVFF